MPQLVRAILGGHAPIVIRAREVRSDSLDGQLYPVSGLTLLKVEDPNGTTVTGTTNLSFAYQQDGVYIHNLDTSGYTLYGDYTVKVEALLNAAGEKARLDFILRLVRQGAP